MNNETRQQIVTKPKYGNSAMSPLPISSRVLGNKTVAVSLRARLLGGGATNNKIVIIITIYFKFPWEYTYRGWV